MGTIKHNAIIVTGWDKTNMNTIRKKAKEIFKKHFENVQKGNKLVSNLVPSLMNEDFSFFIAPDGSKEGWQTSNNGDSAREEFIDYLSGQKRCNYIEIYFGGDFQETPEILNKG